MVGEWCGRAKLFTCWPGSEDVTKRHSSYTHLSKLIHSKMENMAIRDHSLDCTEQPLLLWKIGSKE